MQIIQYEVLLKVLESGTLTSAAEELGYSQSGLTRMLNSLEAELGFPLLVRDRRGVRLSAEGKLALPHIQALLNEQRRLLQCAAEIKNLNLGLITIGTFNSVSAQWLPAIIKEFTALHPGIKFRLLHGNNDQIVEWVQNNQVDIGFTRYSTADDCCEIFLYEDPIVGVFAADSPYADRKEFTLEEMTALPYIALNEGVDDEITEVIAQGDVALQPAFIESDDHAVIAMVEQGLGTSLMSKMMICGFDRNIAAVPLNPPRCRQIGMACKNTSLLSAAALDFWEHVKTWTEKL